MPLVRSPNTHGFFIHIPKCAGTSITKSLVDINCALFLTNQYRCGQIRDYRDYIVHDRWIPNREYPCSQQHWQADLIKDRSGSRFSSSRVGTAITTIDELEALE